MGEEKIKGAEIAVEKNKFLKWLDNYWYHYKWHTLVTLFFVMVIGVCVIQACTNKPKDILITYGGPATLAADDKAAVTRILSEALPESFDKNGHEAVAGFIPYMIYSQEQIKEIEKQNVNSDDPIYIDTVFNSNEYSTLNSQYKTGNGSIYILDKWLYDEILNNESDIRRLKPLAEIFGETPALAIDEFGIRLGDTEIYKNNPELAVLGADSIICLHEQILGQKNYDKEIEAFKAIAKVSAAEEKKDN